MDAKKVTQAMFGVPQALIGMLHLSALPGSPGWGSGDRKSMEARGLDEVISRAAAEAKVYRDAGCHGLMIENMHDRPYLKGAVGPETVAAMGVVGARFGAKCHCCWECKFWRRRIVRRSPWR